MKQDSSVTPIVILDLNKKIVRIPPYKFYKFFFGQKRLEDAQIKERSIYLYLQSSGNIGYQVKLRKIDQQHSDTDQVTKKQENVDSGDEAVKEEKAVEEEVIDSLKEALKNEGVISPEIKEGCITSQNIGEKVFNDLKSIFSQPTPRDAIYKHQEILLRLLGLAQEDEIWPLIESKIINEERIDWILPSNKKSHEKVIYEGHETYTIPVIKGGGQAELAEKLRRKRKKAIQKATEQRNLDLAKAIKEGFGIIPVSTSLRGGDNGGTNAVSRSDIDYNFRKIKHHLDHGGSIWGLGDTRFFIGGGNSAHWFDRNNAPIYDISQGEYVDHYFKLLDLLYNSEGNISEIIQEVKADVYGILSPYGDFIITREEYQALKKREVLEKNSDGEPNQVIVQKNYVLMNLQKEILRKAERPFLQFTFPKLSFQQESIKQKRKTQNKLYNNLHGVGKIAHDKERYSEWINENSSLKQAYETFIKDRFRIYKEKRVNIIVESLTDMEEEITWTESVPTVDAEELKELKQDIIKLRLQLLKGQLESTKDIAEFHLANINENYKEMVEKIFELTEDKRDVGKVKIFFHKESPALVARELTFQHLDRTVALGVSRGSQVSKNIEPLLLIPTQPASEIEEKEQDKQANKVKGKEKEERDESIDKDIYNNGLRVQEEEEEKIEVPQKNAAQEDKKRIELIKKIDTLGDYIINFMKEFPHHPLSALFQQEVLLQQLECYRAHLFPGSSKIKEIEAKLGELQNRIDILQIDTNIEESQIIDKVKGGLEDQIDAKQMKTKINASQIIDGVKNVIKRYNFLRNFITSWYFASEESARAIYSLEEIANSDLEQAQKATLLYAEIIKVVCTHPEKRFSKMLAAGVNFGPELENLEKIRKQAIAQGPIITFLRGRSRICPSDTDPDFCLSVDEFYLMPGKDLERLHQYIQCLFPTEKASEFNDKAPLWTEKETALIEKKEELKNLIEDQLIKNLQLMLSFYGFKLVENESGNPVVRKAENFAQRAENWIGWDNHNYRRITRIFDSLGLKNKEGKHLFPKATTYAQVFLNALKEVAEDPQYSGKISDKTGFLWGIGPQYELIPTSGKLSVFSAFALGVRDLILTGRITEDNIGKDNFGENKIQIFLYMLKDSTSAGNTKTAGGLTLFPETRSGIKSTVSLAEGTTGVKISTFDQFFKYLKTEKDEKLLQERLAPALAEVAIKAACDAEKARSYTRSVYYHDSQQSELAKEFLTTITKLVREKIEEKRNVKAIPAQGTYNETILRKIPKVQEIVVKMVTELQPPAQSSVEQGSSGLSGLSSIAEGGAELTTAEERIISNIICNRTRELIQYWKTEVCQSFFETAIDDPSYADFALTKLAEYFGISLKIENARSSYWLIPKSDRKPELHLGQFSNAWNYYRNTEQMKRYARQLQTSEVLKWFN